MTLGFFMILFRSFFFRWKNHWKFTFYRSFRANLFFLVALHRVRPRHSFLLFPLYFRFYNSFIDLLTLLYPFSCTSQSQTQTFSTTPTILCAIAKEIGGFDKISNLYYDGNWSEHWYARVTIGNQTKDYTFCPDVSTGDIGEIRKINFMDTSKMTKIY